MQRKSLAIATPVGSFKGAFAHGVLTALEEAGIVADAYAAASSSVIPASWAAIGQASNLGIDYWLAGLSALAQRLAPVGFPDRTNSASRAPFQDKPDKTATAKYEQSSPAWHSHL